MQRRKPLTVKHQERRRRALERLEDRISRQKDGPDAKQQQELQSLQATLHLQPS